MRRRELLAAAAGGAALSGLHGCDARRGVEHITGGFNGIDVTRGHALRDAKPTPQPPSRTQRTRVVIAGGGIAGLAAARALRQAGVDDFVLLELEDSAGGNSRAGSVGGNRVPAGRALPAPAGRHRARGR